MSYDIRIWEQPTNRPTPKTLEEAGRAMMALEKTSPGVNPKFIALAAKMMERHAVASVDRPDELDASWLGDPVQEAQELRDAVWAIGIPAADQIETVRFMADAATNLGLTVLDEQLGMAFLPSGIVLPESKRDMWDGAKEAMDTMPARMTKAQMRKVMLSHVKPLFEKHGFRSRKREGVDIAFERAVEGGGSQVVSMWVAGTSPNFKFTVSAECYDPTIRGIVEAVCDKKVFHLQQVVIFSLAEISNLDSQYDYRLSIKDGNEIQFVLSLIEKKMLAALDLALHIRGLDEILNGDFSKRFVEEQREMSLVPLIVARLAGTGNFEEVVNKYIAFYETWPFVERRDAGMPSLMKLIPYLREHVKPVG